MSQPVPLWDYVQFVTSSKMEKLKKKQKGFRHNLVKRIIYFIKELERDNTRSQLYHPLIINLILNLLPPTVILCTRQGDLQWDLRDSTAVNKSVLQ